MRGKFITFEGGEGSGKSTQTQIICDLLNQKGLPHVTTREPGGTKISEAIRSLVLDAKNDKMSLETEMLLFAASRAQLINEFIIPSLESGNIVICDRYIDSSLVYQGLCNDGNIDKVLIANNYAVNTCMPDLTLYFDIDPELAFARKNGADTNDRMEMKGMEFHKKVRQGFCKLAKMYPDRIKVIDASKSVEEVTSQIVSCLESIGV